MIKETLLKTLKLGLLLSLAINVVQGNILSDREAPKNAAIIDIKIQQGTFPDTLHLKIFRDFFISKVENLVPVETVGVGRRANGVYRFLINEIKKPVYISLGAGLRKESNFQQLSTLLSYYLVEPGDHIIVSIGRLIHADSNTSNSTGSSWNMLDVIFMGKGSEKFRYKFQSDTFNTFVSVNKLDSVRNDKIQLLKKYKNKISYQSYRLFEADLIGESRNRILRTIGATGGKLRNVSRIDSSCLAMFLSDSLMTFDANITLRSKNLFEYEYLKSLILYWRSHEAKQDSYAAYIQNHYTGELMQKLLTTYVLDYTRNRGRTEKDISASIQLVSNQRYSTVIKEFQAGVGIGYDAFNFALPDINDRIVRLSDLRGKIIILDFWFTGCTGCLFTYSNVVSKIKDKYKYDTSLVFVTISVDVNKEIWKTKGVMSGKYTSLNSVNLYTEGIGSEHSVIKKYKVFGYPTIFLIDRDGKIISNDQKKLRNFQSLDSYLRALNLSS